jgi:hypothetical protein
MPLQRIIVAFTVYGRFARLPVAITWQEGPLDGPVMVTLPIGERVRMGDQVWATPSGPSWTADLQTPHVALLLIRDALDEIQQVTGDVPGIPGVTPPR